MIDVKHGVRYSSLDELKDFFFSIQQSNRETLPCSLFCPVTMFQAVVSKPSVLLWRRSYSLVTSCCLLPAESVTIFGLPILLVPAAAEMLSAVILSTR